MTSHSDRPVRADFVAHGPPPTGPVETTAADSVASADAATAEQLATTSVGLAGSPGAIVAIWLGWIVTGCVVAEVLARQGHDRRTMTALGLALGPLLGCLAIGTGRWGAAAARPIVLARGTDHGGRRLMVAVTGTAEDVADVEPVIALIGSGVGHVDLVAQIGIEDAVAGRGCLDSSDAAIRAARSLRGAATFIADHRPGIVLVPGRPRTALAEYAAEHDYDVVVMTGPQRACERLARTLHASATPSVFVTHARRHPARESRSFRPKRAS